jgi:hypothetical protein
MRSQYKDQLVNSVSGSNRCLLRESCVASKSSVRKVRSQWTLHYSLLCLKELILSCPDSGRRATLCNSGLASPSFCLHTPFCLEFSVFSDAPLGDRRWRQNTLRHFPHRAFSADRTWKETRVESWSDICQPHMLLPLS